ncbi:MAG: hypothetical protein V4633_03835 [Pseudomonadota bacterium]
MRFALALLALFASPALACSCAGGQDGTRVLHATPAGPLDSWELALPANARGLLYMAPPAFPYLVGDRDSPHVILKEIPPPIVAGAFSLSKAANLEAMPVSLKRLAHGSGTTQYYLADKQLKKQGQQWGDDVHALVRKHRLRNITAETRLAFGLFRIEPQQGFAEGSAYYFQASVPGAGMLGSRVLVKAGPPVLPAPDGQYRLALNGLPKRKLLEVARGGMCSETIAALVQELRYELPPAARQYPGLLMFFTEHKFRQAGMAPGSFFERPYYPDMCATSPYGGSVLGPAADIAFTACPADGKPVPHYLVRGRIGMLEMEDELHEMAPLAIPFSRASGPSCRQLRRGVKRIGMVGLSMSYGPKALPSRGREGAL